MAENHHLFLSISNEIQCYCVFSSKQEGYMFQSWPGASPCVWLLLGLGSSYMNVRRDAHVPASCVINRRRILDLWYFCMTFTILYFFLTWKLLVAFAFSPRAGMKMCYLMTPADGPGSAAMECLPPHTLIRGQGGRVQRWCPHKVHSV